MVFRLLPSDIARRAACVALAIGLAGCAGRTAPRVSPFVQTGPRCLAELDRLGVQYQAAPLTASAGAACTVENPVRVTAATVAWSRPAVANCPFVVTFDQFEREILRPLAARYFGQDIRAIVHLGAYSCRNTKAGRESEHGRGMAIDLAGVELADGTPILVKDKWGGRGKPQEFLRAITMAACRYFNVVLSPDSDRDHWDHIHLDLGPYKLCVTR